MNETIRKITSFFGELRQKDEQTKKQWLIGLTSASMLVVLGLWAVSLNSTLKKLSGPEKSKDAEGFGETISQGMNIVGAKIGKSVSEISDKIRDFAATTNSVTIQPTNINFSENMEPIAPKKFP